MGSLGKRGRLDTNLMRKSGFSLPQSGTGGSHNRKSKKWTLGKRLWTTPPYGFSSMIYLAETQTCIPLSDLNNLIASLKKDIQYYPVKLKESVIQQSLWSAEFAIW